MPTLSGIAAAGVAFHAGAITEQGKITARAAGVTLITFEPRFRDALGLHIVHGALCNADFKRFHNFAYRICHSLGDFRTDLRKRSFDFDFTWLQHHLLRGLLQFRCGIATDYRQSTHISPDIAGRGYARNHFRRIAGAFLTAAICVAVA